MHLENTFARAQVWLVIGVVFIVTAGCQEKEKRMDPIPDYAGLKILVLDRDSGPGGERIRVEGMLPGEDASVAMDRFEAYGEHLRDRGFRPSYTFRNGPYRRGDKPGPCRPPIAGSTSFNCEYEADRNSEVGIENLWVEADGIDKIIGPGGDHGRGVRIRIRYERTTHVPRSQ